jgi:surface carbohydrate biosynthesis protein
MIRVVLTVEPLDMANSPILLPIEEKNRELNARVLIALAAIEKGYDVILGQQWEIFDRFGSLPPSVVLFKGNNASQANHMVRAKKDGHVVCSIEEEVFGICDEGLILSCYDPRTVDLVDLFFVQSDFQRAALLNRWPRLSGRIKVVGNPRNDVLVKLARLPPSMAAERLKREHGPFVLFNTNFASINPAIDDIYGAFELRVRIGLLQPHDAENIRLYHQMPA